MGDSGNNKSKNDSTHREIMLAGAFAAFTVDLLVYPLDTIKTRMQSRDYIKTYAETSSTSSKPIAAAKALKRTAVSSPYALRGLYQGIGTVILATLPASGVFFTTYEWAKKVVGAALPAITNGTQPPSALVHAISSGMAELTACLVITPAEVIKQNAQMIQKNKNKASSGGSKISSASTSLQAFRMLIHAEGGAARRLLSGYTALAARNLPFTALQFPMFEALRAHLKKRWAGMDGSDLTSSNHLFFVGAVNGLSAGTSGSIASVITTPLDVVKTRMMLSPYGEADSKSDGKPVGKAAVEQKYQKAAKPPHGKRLSAPQLARLIYKEHGIRGLFRGGAFRAGWTFVGTGLYLGTYEVAKAYLRGGREEGDDGDDGI